MKKNASEADDAEGDRDRGRLRTVAGRRNSGIWFSVLLITPLPSCAPGLHPGSAAVVRGCSWCFRWVLVMSGYILIEISVRRSTLLRMMQYEMPVDWF